MSRKTIFITGVSSGIGKAAALFFLEQHHCVIGTARSGFDASDFKKFPGFNLIEIDFKNKNDFGTLFQKLEALKIGQIDILINNAGFATAAPFVDQPVVEIEELIEVNVVALMRLTQMLITKIKKNGGRIVNISSVSGINGTPFLAAYCASKHAVEGFSESLRRELNFIGIKVIVVAPGSIKTPIWEKGFNRIKTKYDTSIFAMPFQKFMSFAASEEQNALPVEDVVNDLNDACFSTHPKIRYSPVPRKFRNYYLLKLIPKLLIDKLTTKALGLSEKK